MSNAPLMPMATAVWLVEYTTLTFKQISDFCKLHEVEIQGIADGEVAVGMRGYDPIDNNQLTSDEIKRCEINTPKIPIGLLITIDGLIEASNIKISNYKHDYISDLNSQIIIDDKQIANINCKENIDACYFIVQPVQN